MNPIDHSTNRPIDQFSLRLSVLQLAAAALLVLLPAAGASAQGASLSRREDASAMLNALAGEYEVDGGVAAIKPQLRACTLTLEMVATRGAGVAARKTQTVDLSKAHWPVPITFDRATRLWTVELADMIDIPFRDRELWRFVRAASHVVQYCGGARGAMHATAARPAGTAAKHTAWVVNRLNAGSAPEHPISRARIDGCTLQFDAGAASGRYAIAADLAGLVWPVTIGPALTGRRAGPQLQAAVPGALRVNEGGGWANRDEEPVLLADHGEWEVLAVLLSDRIQACRQRHPADGPTVASAPTAPLSAPHVRAVDLLAEADVEWAAIESCDLRWQHPLGAQFAAWLPDVAAEVTVARAGKRSAPWVVKVQGPPAAQTVVSVVVPKHGSSPKHAATPPTPAADGSAPVPVPAASIGFARAEAAHAFASALTAAAQACRE